MVAAKAWRAHWNKTVSSTPANTVARAQAHCIVSRISAGKINASRSYILDTKYAVIFTATLLACWTVYYRVICIEFQSLAVYATACR